ncbi:hypothetical protein P7K49_018657, partial [Saguinus oedipus]
GWRGQLAALPVYAPDLVTDTSLMTAPGLQPCCETRPEAGPSGTQPGLSSLIALLSGWLYRQALGWAFQMGAAQRERSLK